MPSATMAIEAEIFLANVALFAGICATLTRIVFDGARSIPRKPTCDDKNCLKIGYFERPFAVLIMNNEIEMK